MDGSERRNRKPDAAANTPRPLVVWFVFVDLLLAAALVFIGLKLGSVGLVMAWSLAGVFTITAFMHGWIGLRSRRRPPDD